MGMKIENSYLADGAFLIETTGARFEYVKGELKIYQGLDKNNRRLLSTFTLDDEPYFVKAEASDDHVLFWSEKINLGIYGDSTCILSPKVKQQLKCRGNFKPDYEGRHKGELLLIDDKGGMEIYPQRYEADYKINKINLGKPDWIADYELNAGERVMIAAFPGRKFDWEKSFNSHFAIMYPGAKTKARTEGKEFPLPPKSALKELSKHLDIIIISFLGLYKNMEDCGPYIIANEAEFARFTNDCHEVGIKCVVYASAYYHYRKSKDIELYFKEVTALRDKYGVDGVFIDALICDFKRGPKIDNKIMSFETIRRLRELFGSDGVIVFHGTHGGTPVSTIPNVDTYSDVTMSGENVLFESISDPYMKYQVRKYGISNTIAVMAPGRQTKGMSKKEYIDIMLALNGRYFWWIPLFRNQTYQSKTKIWNTSADSNYIYYLGQLEKLKKAYMGKKKAPKQK